MTDAIDDVSYNHTGSPTVFEGTGDYADWIDFVKINITGSDIIIEFQGTGDRFGDNYSFSISLDVDNDRNVDFAIYYDPVKAGYLMRNQLSADPYYIYTWNGTKWLATDSTFPSTDIGRFLTLKTIGNATSDRGYTLNTMTFIATAFLTDQTTFVYADFMPDVGSEVPGFQGLPLLLSVMTLISLISIWKMKKQ